MDKHRLKSAINQAYNSSEIETLCFDLDIDHENVKGDTKENKIEQLILYCERNDRTSDLIAYLHKKRPTVLKEELDTEALSHYYEFMLPIWDRVDLLGQNSRDPQQTLTKFSLQSCYVPLHIERNQSQTNVVDRAQESEPNDLRGANSSIRQSRKLRYTISDFLKQEKKIVILGDPGSGKTTLTKWLSIACLLKNKPHDAYADFPNIDDLPENSWLPVIIPCRYLDRGSLMDVNKLLTTSLSFELQKPELIEPLKSIILEKMNQGEVLLIIDGLDEISPPTERAKFSRVIDKISHSYSDIPIIVTSRRHGYEQMKFRLDDGFAEVQMSELQPAEQKTFIRQWCQITEQPAFIENRMLSTIDADTIKEIARNPLQLTTIAIVLQKSPNISPKRVDLYLACIDILFHWHPEREKAIDHKIAKRYLGYLAYYMCDEETKTISEDKIISLWDEMQEQYRRRSLPNPEEVLEGLVESTNILIMKQSMSRNGRNIYAFQHALFQDFLAGQQAIPNKLYPGRTKRLPVGEHLPLLATSVEKVRRDITSHFAIEEPTIAEKWYQPILLCLASYEPIDLDDILFSLLDVEQDPQLKRARAVLVASCLLDEPDIDMGTARFIIESLIACAEPYDAWSTISTRHKTTFDEIVVALSQRDTWHQLLSDIVLDAFVNGEADTTRRMVYGRIFFLANDSKAIADNIDEALFQECLDILGNPAQSEKDAVAATLVILDAAFQRRLAFNPGLHNLLIELILNSTPAVQAAAAGALRWLITSYYQQRIQWQPTSEQANELIAYLANPNADKTAVINLFTILEQHIIEAPKIHQWAIISGQKYEISSAGTSDEPFTENLKEALLFRISDAEIKVRTASALLLGQYGILDEAILPPLIEIVQNKLPLTPNKRETAVQIIGCFPSKTVQTIIETLQKSSSEHLLQTVKLLRLNQSTTTASNQETQAINWELTDTYSFQDCTACVLITGRMPRTDEEGYVYVALHLGELLKMILEIEADNFMNASKYHATVLARFPGQPSDEVKEFMRRKFGFSDEEIIIQRESSAPIRRSIPTPDSPILDKNDPKAPVVNEKENDFPLKEINFMRIGSGYLKETANYDTNLILFQVFCDRLNNIYDAEAPNQIKFEAIEN